jgi:uncharacterized protein
VHFFFERSGEVTLRAQIEILASLQDVDREIKEKNGIKQGLLGELQKREREIQAKRQAMATVTAECFEKEKLRREKERVLQEEGKKAVDRRMRMNRIKNIKELQALQREIDQIKHSNGELEEELIGILEEIEGVKAVLKGKEEELGKMEVEWKQKQEEMRTQISGIDQAVSEASTLRQNIASQISGDLVQRYELIFARRGGTAVVTVADGICQGCFMNIPPQLWNEIMKSEKVILCPSCNRILYSNSAPTNDRQV